MDQFSQCIKWGKVKPYMRLEPRLKGPGHLHRMLPLHFAYFLCSVSGCQCTVKIKLCIYYSIQPAVFSVLKAERLILKISIDFTGRDSQTSILNVTVCNLQFTIFIR